MKQHITVEQLNELTAEQKDRLRAWWKPQEGDRLVWLPMEYVEEKCEPFARRELIFRCKDRDYTGEEYILLHMKDTNVQGWARHDECFPLLSIGQCIQLLKSKVDDWGMMYMDTTCDWCVYIGHYEDIKKCWCADELKDALWQAVKEVL